MKNKTGYLKMDATETEVLLAEKLFINDGLVKVNPSGYHNYYDKFHYKAYFTNESGKFYVIEGNDDTNSSYMIEELR